jgi:glutamate synthase domain-containing protein 2
MTAAGDTFPADTTPDAAGLTGFKADGTPRRSVPRPSATFPPATVEHIQTMARTGRYEIRGWGAKRRVPNFDDLTFLTASASRYPLEGYRERCETRTVLGSRFATKPLELDIPITIAGMSFGSLSANAKEALGRAASAVGTSTTTGDGGMTPEERKSSKTLVYQCLPSRYGFNPADLHAADAIEVVIGQGAKPGGGGMLLGQKVSERVAGMRTLPPGVDQRSASRHPDWTGPDDLTIKIAELREATNWEKPIYVKLGATRVNNDVKLAIAAGADVVVVDGMQGGTGATQDVFIEHAGIPTLAAVRLAAEAIREVGKVGEVQLIVSGGIRSGADVAKALALGADAVAIGVGALIALGCNASTYYADGDEHDATASYAELGVAPGFCHHCHTGFCPVGVTTQEPRLERRLDPEVGAGWMTNYLKALTMELTTLARACGKLDVHHLEPEDLAALTIEAAAMAKVPLAGTSWIPGAGL